MNIFSKEKSIANKIQELNTASLCVPVNVKEADIEGFASSLQNIKQDSCDKEVAKAIAKLDNHPDLLFGSAILVSTVMNLNDDVFLPEETWKARYTPVNTPYNDQHVAENIIGHIYAVRFLDEDGEAIEAEKVPDYFDIEADFVLYKTIFPELANSIAEKAPKGETFVSMECRINNFDYALIDQASGNCKLVARNEDTAFLTKHLRIYGGSGTYEDYTVGRVLRDFRFCGMGNVDVPANPDSVYTRIQSVEEAEASILEDNPIVILSSKGKTMQFKSVEEAVAKIEELQAELETLRDQKDQEKVDSLTQELEAEKTKVSTLEQKLEEATQKVESTETELNETKEQLEAKVNELNEIEAQNKLEARLSELQELGVTVSDEKKDAIASMSDEVFESLVEWNKQFKEEISEANTDEEDDDKSKNKNKKDKKGGMKAKANAENKANEELENVEEDEASTPESAAGDDTADELQQVASKVAASLLKHRHRAVDFSKK